MIQHHHGTVTDPGFPRGGAPTPRGGPTYDFAKFSQKMHEIERIWIPMGESLAPNLRSATVYLLTVTVDKLEQKKVVMVQHHHGILWEKAKQ